MTLEKYWNDIPIGKDKAVSYDVLCALWNTNSRTVRRILNKLSSYDNGDKYILIRSSHGKGFYKTDDISEIMRFKKECTNRAVNTFAPLKKINRVLDNVYIRNSLKPVRVASGLSQDDVCKKIGNKSFDVPLLSRMENGICLPTPEQIRLLSEIYGVETSELFDYEMYCLYCKTAVRRLASQN